MSVRVRLTRKRVVILVAVAGLVSAGVAYATIPDGNKVFTACMLKNVGTVRLIDPSLPAANPMAHCSSLETQVSWSQQGQPGPTGPAGPQGQPGKDGLNGTDGRDGTNGTNGTNGTDGKDGLSVTNTGEPAGANCANGGSRFSVGNGLATFACNGRDGNNGKDGVDGTNGVDGKDGKDGTSVTNAVEAAGANCAYGGARFTVGDGSPTFACNGKDGVDGTNGTNGVDGKDGKDGVSVTSAAEPAGTHCTNGGSKFTAANGVTYACNGAPGSGGGPTGQSGATVQGSAGVILSASNPGPAALPGVSQTINVPANSVVFATTDGQAQLGAASATEWIQLAVDLVVDGSLTASRTITILNGSGFVGVFGGWSMSQALTLSPGTHTISVQAQFSIGSAGATATVSGGPNTFARGALTILTLKT